MKIMNIINRAVNRNNRVAIFIKKLVPKKLRSSAREFYERSNIIEIPDHVFKVKSKKTLQSGVNLIGYSRSEMGVGEACRIMAHCLDHSGYPYGIYPILIGDPNRKKDLSLLEKESVEFNYNINLLSLNAEQLPNTAKILGQILEVRYNIGYWFWELPELPEEHVFSFNYLDEIWAPSRFIYKAIQKKSPIPVYYMPLAVRVNLQSKSITRQEFNLPENAFLFLCMYDLHSASERKNAGAAIRAFQSAFNKDNKKVGLVVKINNAVKTEEEQRRLQELICGYENIIIINQIFTREQVNALLNNIDAVISLHRSEGFGLVMAEAMYLGKVAIATGWSGNIDFMNEKNSCLVDYKLITLDRDYGPYKKNQVWADPDEEHAAFLMNRVFNDTKYYNILAAAGKKTIRTEYSPEVVGNMIKNRINAIEECLDMS